MKNEKELLEVVRNENQNKKISDNTKVGNNLKKVIYLISLAGIGLFFSACDVGYVATEPQYVESARPDRPSETHIWIDGDWQWNRQTQVYVRNSGHWDNPGNGRTYQAGYWQQSSKGKHWVKGRYHKR